MNGTGAQPEPERDLVAGAEWLAAYSAVFSVQGKSQVADYGRQVQYAEDLVRRLPEVQQPAFAPINLTKVRNSPRGQLLKILFKAVAGHFLAGRGTLPQEACRLEADPATGVLELHRKYEGRETTLIVIILILLCTLSVLLYRREAPKAEKK